MLQTAFNLLRHIGTCRFIHKHLDPRFQNVVALDKLTNSLRAPHQTTLIGKVDLGVGGIIEAIRPKVEMRCQCLKAGLLDGFGLLASGVLVPTEPEPFETTDEFSFDGHFSVFIYFGQKGLLLLQPPQQNTCPPVNKSLGQTLV